MSENNLYNTTKQLLNLIKEVKPEIEIIQSHYWVSKNNSIVPSTDVNSGYPSTLDSFEYYVYYITSESLLTLIPQLFEGVENPEYKNSLIVDCYGDRIYTATKTLSQALLSSYFVDGLWVQSQEAVLEDLINNINTYLK
jgi:hypothetical protein